MSVTDRFEKDGFVVVPDLLSVEECSALATELTAVFEQRQKTSPKTRGGLRNVLRVSPRASAAATSEKFVSVVSTLTGGRAFPVRAILFDKTDGANWGVPWHQDLAIAVAGRIETEGFGSWSVKEGIVHVQPPQHILADMVTIRLHLDDCTAKNGALRVLPGSHLEGELSDEAILEWADKQSSVTCEITKGGALLMRPLFVARLGPGEESLASAYFACRVCRN